jgi:hypothetical protein
MKNEDGNALNENYNKKYLSVPVKKSVKLRDRISHTFKAINKLKETIKLPEHFDCFSSFNKRIQKVQLMILTILGIMIIYFVYIHVI